MEKFEDTTNGNATSDLVAEMMMDKKDGEEFTRGYLKARFLSSVGRSLYYARRQAGLTQEQVAERMNTKQSVIARFEADKKGSMSFHRYVDFCIACDAMPRSLTLHSILEPIHSIRDEIIARAESSGSQESFTILCSSSAQISTANGMMAHLANNLASSINLSPLTSQDALNAIATAQKIVSQPQQQCLGENMASTSANPQTSKSDQLTIKNERRVLV